MIDTAIIQLLSTIASALISAIATIIVAYIQASAKTRAQGGTVLLPDGVKIRHRSALPIVWILVFTLAGGVVGYLIGGAFKRQVEQPALVTDEHIESGITREFLVELRRDEVVVGEGWMVNDETNEGRGCIAFLVSGPGEFEMKITSGRWRRFKQVGDIPPNQLGHLF
jgi:hypothetical protein